MIKKIFNRWKDILFITLVVRLVLFVFAVLISGQPLADFFNLWIHWDGPHYIDIARYGYQTTGDPANFIVFYPLYPLTIKIFSFLFLNFTVAAVLTSTCFTFIAAVFLYELTLLDEEDKHTAILAVWFLNIFPVSYFLQASYTESLFLATSLGTVYFFRRGKYLSAGTLGAAATATRVNGLLLFPLILLFLKRHKLTFARSSQLLTFLLMPIGFLGYLIINYILFKNPFYFTIPLSEHWYKHLELPWSGVINLVNNLSSLSSTNSYIYYSEIIAIAILFFLTILVFIKTKIEYGIYVLLNFLLFISTSFILSTPRYIIILFPIYIALAKIKNSVLFFILNLICLSLLLYLTQIYTSGKWAY